MPSVLGPLPIRADSRRDYLTRLRTLGPTRARRAAVVPRTRPGAGDGRARTTASCTSTSSPAAGRQRAALALARRGAGRAADPVRRPCRADVRGAAGVPQLDRRAALDSPHEPPANAPRIGFLGRLSTDKGLDVLAAALTSPELAGRADLVVAGDARWVPTPTSTPGSRQALDALGAARPPRGHGALRTTSSPRSTSSSSPAVVAESFGLVAAEAMASRGAVRRSPTPARCPRSPVPTTPGSPGPATSTDLARVIERALAAPTERGRARDRFGARPLGG